MYYIKKIDKDYLKQNENEYFNIYLDSIKAKEDSSILNLSGTVKIISNAKLPNFTYYLTLESSLGKADKINLNLIKTNEKTKNNEVIWREEYYSFNIYFNLDDSSKYSGKVYNKHVYFKFIPIMNQNVINDFKISIDNNILYNFIYNLNNQNLYKESIYSNNFKLEAISKKINLAELENISDESNVYYIKHEDHSSLISSFFHLNFESPIKIEDYQAKLTYISENKINEIDIELSVDNINQTIYVKPKYWYFYNSNLFEISNEGSYGIIANSDLNFKIDISLILNINNTKKYFDYSNEISLKQNDYFKLINNVKIDHKNFVLSAYMEVQNYEIF